VVLVDIDQLRRSQQELREARDFSRLVVESIPLPLVVLDLEFRIRTSNGAFSELLGIPAADLEKKPLPDLAQTHWGLDEPLRSQLAELRNVKNAGSHFEFVHQTQNGRPRSLSFVGCVLQPDGESFLLVTIEDISAHKEIERLLQEEGKRLAV